MSPLNMLSNIFTDWFLRGQQEGTEGHSTETYFSTTTPILYGSYRGKKHQIIQQSLKTALDVLNNRTNKSGHQSSTWPDKVEEDYWINQPINAALRHHKIHLVNVEPCSKEFEALEFSKNKDKYGYSVLLQLVLALARCPLSVVGACDSAIEKELTDVVMGPINSHIQSVKAKTTPVSTTKKEEGHEEDENERNEGLVKLKQGDISPWLISTLKNIKPIEQYEFNIDIKSDNNASSSSSASRRLVKRSEKIAFSSRIHLRDYSPSSMPSSHVSLPDHIIDESAHRLYKRLTSIVSGSACIIVLMDVMKWIDEFSKQKQKDLEAERIHHSPQHKCTDGWVSYEWDVFRSMLRKCLESNGNLHFVLTTLPTPRDSLDPDFFSNESLSDHPFISRFLGESKRAVEEPIEAGLLLWRNEPLLSCAKSINLNNGIPTKHSSSVNLVARKESLREKLENSHEMLAVISKREKRKYSPAAPDTVIVAIVDALKLNEVIIMMF